LKWYVEEETKELRESLENEILNWPSVTAKKMFGCPCYLVNRKMFAGMVTKGIVIPRLSTQEKVELGKVLEIKPFVAGKRIMKNWVRVNLTSKEITKILPYVKKSYERTLMLQS
jgi:hypothetical protein